MAHAANRRGHVLRHPFAVSIRAGLFEIVFQELQDTRKAEAFVTFRFLGGSAVPAAVFGVRRRVPVQKHVLDARRKFFERRIELELVRVSTQFERPLQNRGARTRPEAAFEKRAGPIIDDLRRIKIVFRAEPVARRARAVGRIEAERARLEHRNGNPAIRTSELFRKRVLLSAHDRHGHQPAGELQRCRNGLLQPRRNALLDEQAVHHDFDGVILALVQCWKIVERVQLAVDAHAHVPLLGEFLQLLAVRAFSPAHNRRQDHDAVVGLRDFSVQDRLHNLLARLPRDGLAAMRAVRHADRRVHHAQVIVDLGDGAHGRTRGARGGFLLDGDRRRKPFDHVHFGPFHLVEKLPCVSRQRFDVAALSFGINGVKRK